MSTAASKSTRRSERRSDRRQSLIEGAARLFAELGYADCDMERVAESQGIAKGTVYLYFPSKQDLFFACVDWGMQEMQKSIRAAADSSDEPYEKIGRGIRAYLGFFEANPHFVELILQERAIFKDRKRPTYFEHRDANRVYWRDLYRKMIADGQFRNDLPVEHILDTIGNLLYGTMFTNHFLGRTISPDEQYAGLMESVFRGFLSEKERGAWKLPSVSSCVPPPEPAELANSGSPVQDCRD